MNTEYHYILMSQQDLLQNEVIEEILRERTNSYSLQRKNNDFWILISPEFARNNFLNSKIKQTNFYKQKKSQLVANNNCEFYSAIVSSNKEFITWISLRLGYFENIDNQINSINEKFVSNGVSGKINLQNITEPFNSNLKYIHPNLLINKYKKLLELFYNN